MAKNRRPNYDVFIRHIFTGEAHEEHALGDEFAVFFVRPGGFQVSMVSHQALRDASTKPAPRTGFYGRSLQSFRDSTLKDGALGRARNGESQSIRQQSNLQNTSMPTLENQQANRACLGEGLG